MSKFILITGLPCSGKTTIAKALQEELNSGKMRNLVLDGDDVRNHLNNDLGFSEEDRAENIRRIGGVGKIALSQGIICICSIIAPNEQVRKDLASLFHPNEFVLIYLSTPLEICKDRDVKGMYAKAKKGIITNFTGVQAAYDAPQNADLVFDTSVLSLNEIVSSILSYLNV